MRRFTLRKSAAKAVRQENYAVAIYCTFFLIFCCSIAGTGFAQSAMPANKHFVLVLDIDRKLCRNILDVYNRSLQQDLELAAQHPGTDLPAPDYQTRNPSDFSKIGLMQPKIAKNVDGYDYYRLKLFPDQGEITVYRIEQSYYDSSMHRLIILPSGLHHDEVISYLQRWTGNVQPPPVLFPGMRDEFLTKWPHYDDMVARKARNEHPYIIPNMYSGPLEDMLFDAGSSGYVFISSNVYRLDSNYPGQNVIRVYKINPDYSVKDLCYLALAPSELLRVTLGAPAEPQSTDR